MKTDVQSLVDLYIEWLRSECTERDLEQGWSALTFPFLDRHNDHLQIFAIRDDDGVEMTDEGRVFADLKQSGCDLRGSTKRRSIAARILKSFGLDPDLIDDEELSVFADNREVPQRLHSLIMSMLTIGNLTSISQPSVAALFKEDVANWFAELRVPYSRDENIQGKSALVHHFDFAIQRTRKYPPRIVHTLGNPDRMHIQSYTYSVIDVRENGENLPSGMEDPEFFVVLNDAKPVSDKGYLAFLANNITPLTWSNRAEHKAKFAYGA